MKKLKNKEEQSFRLGAVKFWITPAGEALFVEDTHIMAVLRDPRLFGYGGVEELWERFDANGEKRGSECKTRTEILSELMAKGFMRVRRDRGGGRIAINCVRTGGAELCRARKFLDRLARGSRFPVCGSDAPEKKTFARESDTRIVVEFIDFADGRVLLRAPMSYFLGSGWRARRPIFRSGE